MLIECHSYVYRYTYTARIESLSIKKLTWGLNIVLMGENLKGPLYTIEKGARGVQCQLKEECMRISVKLCNQIQK